MSKISLIACLVFISSFSVYSPSKGQAAYPDSLPLFFFRTSDESNNFYIRYGKAYGIIFSYQEVLNQLSKTNLKSDSTFVNANKRFANLYEKPLLRTKGYNKFLNIEKSLEGAETKIRTGVQQVLVESKDTLSNYTKSFFNKLEFWKQEDAVMTFANVFDPNYIINPSNEIADSFYYNQKVISDSLPGYSLAYKLPTSFDIYAIPSNDGYKSIIGYASGAGCGELVFSISCKESNFDLSEAEFKQEVEKPAGSASISAMLASMNRNARFVKFYKHSRGYFGLNSRFKLAGKIDDNNIACESFSLMVPGQNVVFAFLVRSPFAKDENQIYSILDKWQGVIDYIMGSLVIQNK